MPNTCGKAAGALIPRLGQWYACVLEPGHPGNCQRGGNCFKHGAYVGNNCPHWPECIPTATELLTGLNKIEETETVDDVVQDIEKRSEEVRGMAIALDTIRQLEASLAMMEEKLPCGHRRANEVGGDGGTFYCEVCQAKKQAKTYSAPDPAVTSLDRMRAEEFQHRIAADVSFAVGDKVWWASIRFPEVLAAEFAKVRMEGILFALQEKNWIFKNESGTVEIDFPATLRAVGEAAVEEYKQRVVQDSRPI